jgi:DNA-binding response OmpR family regulator
MIRKGNEYSVTIDADSATGRLVEEVSGQQSLPFATAGDFLAVASFHAPTAVLLDANVDRHGGGLELVPKIVTLYPGVPILVLGRPGDKTLQQALALGAADFVPKPLQRNELMARLFKRLSEAKKYAAAVFIPAYGDIELGVDGRLVVCTQGRKAAQLQPSPFRVLQALVDAQGEVMERGQLAAAGWKGAAISANALDQQVHVIRRSLVEIDSVVQVMAVYGIGFRLALT